MFDADLVRAGTGAQLDRFARTRFRMYRFRWWLLTEPTWLFRMRLLRMVKE